MTSISARGESPTVALERFNKSLKGQALEASIYSLTSLLKRRQIYDSEPCAVATANLLLQVVAKSKATDVDQLLSQISTVGSRLVAAQPKEPVVANIVRRVLGLIRDEAEEDRNGNMSQSSGQATPTGTEPLTTGASTVAGDSFSTLRQALTRASTQTPPGPYSVPKTKSLLHLLSAAGPTDGSVFGLNLSGSSTPTSHGRAKIQTVRSEVIDGIEEIKDEIDQVDDQISANAEAQIRPGEYVMVHEPSATVRRFLLKAASKRRFTLIVVVHPSRQRTAGTVYADLGKSLAKYGVSTINVVSSGVTAYMPRVNKVVLGSRAVFADGSVLMDAGTAVIARAAKKQGSAVVILSGVYKFSPEIPFDEAALVDWGNPSLAVDYSDGDIVNHVTVENPVTELITEDLVDIYVSNLGVHSRDHLSNIIDEHYKQEDLEFYTAGDTY
ncbi:related to translation initiation factor GCD7 [Cephalotrichum gorgonifer]|uniref:Translation initiation factor eIF2B subunit beta n=1 Tax=Cephalotrichum gorgonifer TaxID=2041049 RepID=A0AAE8MQY6_9PEZI|nr:related to translation initiation factor GCD7 [Cephalotrichum gorgonifer]